MQKLQLSQIQVKKRRKVDADKVADLAKSIESLGLLQPIVVREDYTLVAGNHRLEAVKLLGWESIDANVVSLDDLRAELAEIDENLSRNEGTTLQRGNDFKRRKEIYEALYPETKHGASGQRGSGAGKTISKNEKNSFSEDTAKKVGKTTRTIEQEVRIAKNITPEVQEMIEADEESPLADSKTDLLALASIPQEQQMNAAKTMMRMADSDDSTARDRAALIKSLNKVSDQVREDCTQREISDPQLVELLEKHKNSDIYDEVIYAKRIRNTPLSEASALDFEQHLFSKRALLGVPKVLQMSISNEWYTPKKYIEAARLLMGGIDTDPASNEEANKIVRATTFYTLEDDGLQHDWFDRVFLNPPYGREGGDSNQSIWSARLIEQFEASNTSEAVLLVNAVTDRKWFQPLWDYPICFTDHRIKFYLPGGEAGQAVTGNSFVYFGHQNDRFAEIFSSFGVVVSRYQTASMTVKVA